MLRSQPFSSHPLRGKKVSVKLFGMTGKASFDEFTRDFDVQLSTGQFYLLYVNKVLSEGWDPEHDINWIRVEKASRSL